MSNRTAKASKAIREAWERERSLVLKGEGTRDWTPEEQDSIIKKGKAYDEEGRAYEGHHMKSAEKYPEYQGDADNIQFLTREEHKDVHKGDFRTPTNGYYNPETKTSTDFGNKKYIPVKTVKLTNPQKKQAEKNNFLKYMQNNNADSQKVKTIENIEEQRKIKFLLKNQNVNFQSHTRIQKVKKVGVLEKILDFPKNHPVITKLGKIGFNVVLQGILTNDDNDKKNDNAVSIQKESDNISHADTSKKDYPDGRASPSEHSVNSYCRKDGTPVKGYKRGGSKK